MADDNIIQRLDRIDIRLDRIEAHIEGIDTSLDRVDTRLDRVDTRLECIEFELLKNDERHDERHAELLAILRDMRDQAFVQGGILTRIEHRDRTADGTTLALQQQLHRLQERVRALEEKLG
jgi:chaperonin cofactor prefoldin